jgi:hypothetical protein
MTTNRRGRHFISYRRLPHRVAEAVAVRDALRDRGVPTWRDLDDLADEPTEQELVQVIRDSDTAGAVILACPETSSSAMVQKVELPEIFARHAKKDGFQVKPVIIGLDYAAADKVMGSPAGFQDLGNWNLTRTGSDSLTADETRALANAVLTQRLTAMVQQGRHEPLRIGVFTRRVERSLAFDLRHDFSAYFTGRTPHAGAFETIERALHDTASAILTTSAPKHILCEGAASLPAAVLLGAVFSPLAGFQVGWNQALAGHAGDVWSLAAPRGARPLNVKTTRGELESNAIVLAVGVNAAIEPAVADFVRDKGLRPRACVYAEPQGGPLRQGEALAPGDGLNFVLQAADAMRDLKDQLRLRTAEVHVFLACPLAMGMLLGQKLNTFSKCHLYEHVPSEAIPYLKVHAFDPSSFSY